MTPHNTRNDGTVADRTRADLFNSILSTWEVVSDNDDTTNVDSPTTSITSTNGDVLVMPRSYLDSPSEGHTSDCLDDSSEEGETGKDDDESESHGESENDDEEVHVTRKERVKQGEQVRSDADHSQMGKLLKVDCRLRIRNEKIGITAGRSTKHARDDTPCDGEPWVKRQKIDQTPSLYLNTAHMGDKSIWKQVLIRQWTHDNFSWDYRLIGSQEQPYGDDSSISSQPGAAFSEAAVKKIRQALIDSVGPSSMADKSWDWEYMVGETNMFHRRGYIRFKYTEHYGLQIENLQYRPDMHPAPRVTDDSARDFVQSIFSIAGLTVYQSLCDRTSFVDDGSREKFVYSSDAYTSADANQDWECLPGEAHRLGTDVSSLGEAWNLGELFYLPGTKGFRVALWPSSRYCKGEMPSSIPEINPQNACRLLDNIFHALKPLGHHKWPRIVRRRQDDKSCLYFYGKSGKVRFTGDKESSEKALKLLWLMCGDQCAFNQRRQFDPDAKDISAIATTGYGIMGPPNDSAMALPNTKEDALLPRKNHVESIEFITKECLRFETSPTTGSAIEQKDKEGWEKLSSSETSEQVSDEIRDECHRRRDLNRWCESSIPDFEASPRGVVWEAVVTYEQSIFLYEWLAKRFVEPNQLLPWSMVGATWNFALRENMLAGFLSIGYKIGEGLELSFLGTERASRSAVALLLELFGDDGYPGPGETKPYTKEDAVKDWEFSVSQDYIPAFDDADCTVDSWDRWDYSQLCSLKGEEAFIVVPRGHDPPSDATELLPSAQDSRRIYDRLTKAVCKASAPLDTPYDENWALAMSRVHNAHGEKFFPSRLLFEGHEDAGGTCGFVFEGRSQDTFAALRLLWSLLGDDWEVSGIAQARQE